MHNENPKTSSQLRAFKEFSTSQTRSFHLTNGIIHPSPSLTYPYNPTNSPNDPSTHKFQSPTSIIGNAVTVSASFEHQAALRILLVNPAPWKRGFTTPGTPLMFAVASRTVRRRVRVRGWGRVVIEVKFGGVRQDELASVTRVPLRSRSWW